MVLLSITYMGFKVYFIYKILLLSRFYICSSYLYYGVNISRECLYNDLNLLFQFVFNNVSWLVKFNVFTQY